MQKNLKLSANAKKKAYICVGEYWEGMNKSGSTYFVRMTDSLACIFSFSVFDSIYIYSLCRGRGIHV